MRRYIPFGLIGAVVALTACQGLFSPTLCTDEAKPGFVVTVVDSISGVNLAPGAVVWVRDGALVDTLQAPPGGAYNGVYERAGTYEVVVQNPDYIDWRQTGVTVRKDECHVISRQITARMVPRP